MYETKEDLDHIEGKFAKKLRFSCKKSQIRIRNNYSGSRSDLAKNTDYALTVYETQFVHKKCSYCEAGRRQLCILKYF
jgi:hypothetical protein